VKPLIVPVLTGFAISIGAIKSASPKNLIFYALLFAWSGDILLMFQETHLVFFLAGLASFFLMHLLYAFIFWNTRNRKSGPTKRDTFVFLFISLLYASAIFLMIYSNLGALRGPVIGYTTAILLMAYAALARKNVTTAGSFRWVMMGAIVFIISDSLLAINKFGHPITHSGVWIMLTYMTSQFMIITGLSKHQ